MQKEVINLEKLEQAKAKLREYNQEHIIKILEKIEKKEQEELVEQIINFDFEQIEIIYKNKDHQEEINKVQPINSVDKSKLSIEEKQELDKLGEEIIKNDQYAVVTMAGGQGTRLGCNGPKGAFKLDIGENGKYIFELLIDTLKRAENKYGVAPYWYIMTSEDNNKQTIEFMEENNYFGYNKEKVRFFIQGELPVTTLDGKLLIDKDYKIKTASDGNGSVYVSLKKSGMLADMEAKGIKWVYLCGVDNIMVNMVDTTFLGLAIKKGVLSGSKSIEKNYPEEKVGVFCKKNGKLAVIEYMEMTDDMLYQKNEDGGLTYGESHFVSYVYNIEALKEIANHNLKYHCAVKKNAYIDEECNVVIPEEANSCKFESFVFDALEFLDDMVIMRVDRDEEFAPIKNITGIDSPATAKEIYENYWSKHQK